MKKPKEINLGRGFIESLDIKRDLKKEILFGRVIRYGHQGTEVRMNILLLNEPEDNVKNKEYEIILRERKP